MVLVASGRSPSPSPLTTSVAMIGGGLRRRRWISPGAEAGLVEVGDQHLGEPEAERVEEGRERAPRRQRVDARMRIEALVLDRQHGIPGVLRDGGERDVAALLPRARRHQRRQHRSVEGDCVARALAGEGERANGAAAPSARRRERHFNGLPACGSASRPDHDRVAHHGELAGAPDPGTLRVAEIVQADDQIGLGERLAAAQLEGTRVDARQRSHPFPLQPCVDEGGERHVGVVAGGGHRQHPHGREQQQVAQQAASPAFPLPGSRTRRLLWQSWQVGGSVLQTVTT